MSQITTAPIVHHWLLMQYDRTFYEYDGDQGAGTDTLCKSTLQLVPDEPERDIVETTESTETKPTKALS